MRSLVRFGLCSVLRSKLRPVASQRLLATGTEDTIFTDEDARKQVWAGGREALSSDGITSKEARSYEATMMKSRASILEQQAEETTEASLDFAARIETFEDDLARLSHRPLNVFLRPRMVDRVRDFEALLRRKSIPGVVQGSGVIMTVGIPYEPILRDLAAGWFCSRHDEEKVESLFCGPVYDVRIYRDNSGVELMYRERAYASVLLYSPDSQMPISLRLLRVPLDADFDQRMPFHTFNEHLCHGLIQGGTLVKVSHGLSVSVPPEARPPQLLWVDMQHFQMGDTVYAHHALRPQLSEFVRWVEYDKKVLYRIVARQSPPRSLR